MFNEDCINGLVKQPDNSVDLIFCDLPYGCTRCSWDKKLNLNKLAEQLWRVAKEETPIIFTATMKFGLEVIDAMGRKFFKFDMVWDKVAQTTPFLAKVRPLKQHELVFVFYKKQPKIYKRKIAEYHTEYTEKRGCVRTNDGIYGKKKDSKKTKTYKIPLPRTIIQVKKLKNNLNSTQKPQPLIEFFIKYYTDEGGVVLDPTFGSCSTGIACLHMNRKFIGYELNEIQYKQGVKRFEDELKIMAKKQQEAQQEAQQAEAKNLLVRAGKMALYARKKRAKKFNKKAQAK